MIARKLLLLAAPLLLGGLLWRWGSDATAPATRVAPGIIAQRLVAQARVVPRGGVADVRPQIAGHVARVLVSEGDRVRAGQLLAEIDAEDLAAELQRQEAEVRSLTASAKAVASSARSEEVDALQAQASAAREELAQAVDAAQRSAVLREKGVETEVHWREAQRAESIARARLDAAEARLRMARRGGTPNDVAAARERVSAASAASQRARLEVARTRLVSPIDGVVLARKVDAGDTLVASQIDSMTAFEIADVNENELRIEVEELDAGRLSLDQPVAVTALGGGALLGRGRITRLASRLAPRQIGEGEGRVRADGRVRVAWAAWQPEPSHRLTLDERVEVAIALEPRRVAARLPRSAVLFRDGRALVQRRDTLFPTATPITVGVADADYVEVTGLAEGTLVSTAPQL